MTWKLRDNEDSEDKGTQHDTLKRAKQRAQMSWEVPVSKWRYDKKDKAWYSKMGIFQIKKRSKHK